MRIIILILCILYSFCITYIDAANGSNVAYNKTASLFSQYLDWSADKAVDGCTLRDDPENQTCCSASQSPGDFSKNYWQVELGGPFQLDRVRLYSRTNRPTDNQIMGFEIYGVLNGTKTLLFNDTDKTIPTDGITDIQITYEGDVSTIRIERPEYNILVVCELEVYTACDDGLYGENCTEVCGSCKDQAPCDKENGTCALGCEYGWQGTMCTERENVAFNASAIQNSDESSNTTADNAVDGCTTQTTPIDGCCSSTNASTNNELKINLGGNYDIGLIRVYGQQDAEAELSGFTVHGLGQSSRVGELLYNNSGVAYGNGVFSILVEPSKMIREITLKRTTTAESSLTVCEIEAFEVCTAGSYGDLCELTCGNCLNNETCHGISGLCDSGCAAGWHGNVCKTACSNGTFGVDCNNTCGNCLDDDVCGIVDGACPNGCDAGYHNDTCLSACENGTFGFNCNETCGHCANADQCDTINGTCPNGCAAGFHGDMCKMDCVSPSFGVDCNDTCNCLNNDTCDTVEGTCPNGCAAGWNGTSCNHECLEGTFGENCGSTCGQCANQTACNIVDGSCPDTCAPGWTGITCLTSCSESFYGDNCTGTCGQCNNNETCDFETGKCTDGCAAGWQGDMCQTACTDGAFGEGCIGKCFCAEGEPCDKVTGECQNGCEVGYSGDFCHIDLNRARSKSTDQSSTLFEAGFLWNASLAVDGDISQTDPEVSQTCSSTEPGTTPFPWWSIDLESVGRIENILVYGLKDNASQLQNFNMYLSNSTLNTSMIEGMQPSYNSTDIPYDQGIYNITYGTGVQARYVYISLPTPEFSLTLCEVRIFGDCPDGTFGPECDGSCRCADNVPCDKDTGVCPGGDCQPGWTTPQCNETCPNGTYGAGCNEQCGTCANNDNCDHVTGVCANGCSPGWLDTNCSRACDDGLYGQDCNSTCGNCKNGDPCNNENGACASGCSAGFNGTFCMTGCENGTYGEDCTGTCGSCINDTICNSTTGECALGCQDGYEGSMCVASQVGNPDSDDDDGNLVAVVAGVIGGVVFIVIVAVIIKLYKARSSNHKGQMSNFSSPYSAAMSESERSYSSSTMSYEYQTYYNVNTKL